MTTANKRIAVIEKQLHSQKPPQGRRRAELETMLDRMSTKGIESLQEPLRSIVAAVQTVRAVGKNRAVIK